MRCAGVLPLPARLDEELARLCSSPSVIDGLLRTHGSPVNVLDPAPMARNAAELMAVAEEFGTDLAIYFARKANKALCFVDEARRLGLGVDLAGERELQQTLDRGVTPGALIMTAAIKPEGLLRRCLTAGVTVVLDNRDELDAYNLMAATQRRTGTVALRLAPELGDGTSPTRFGFTLAEATAVAGSLRDHGQPHRLLVDGVHFHLDGYDPAHRVTAIGQSLELVDALREQGHQPSFIDIGGGIPVSYLQSGEDWKAFWDAHRSALLGEREPLTFGEHGLGLIAHEGQLIGRPSVYPFHQGQTRASWLREVLDATLARGGRRGRVCDELRRAGLQLRCEPGRALLDGCGLTAARVQFRKQRADGTWLIGLAMNRTQCRSTSDDFMVDPLLLRPDSAGPPSPPIEGYLVGAYCIERELLTWRRLRFDAGVAVGDIVVFPNTAGYLMHILESSSHQMPLARNVVSRAGAPAHLDAIDQSVVLS